MAALINELVAFGESISAHHHHKKQMAARAVKAPESRNASTRSEQPREISPLEEDEHDWALDDAQHEVVGESAPMELETDEALVDHFLRDRPPPEYTETHHASQRIPFPVVLPQRSPNTHSGGFIRAYAPVLVNRGIDHVMFLHFLEYFDKSTRASRCLNAVNLAGTAFGFLPPGTSTAIEIATAIAVEAGVEAQGRGKSSTFLDRINNEFFRPRGLFCLILTWNPEIAESQTSVDLASANLLTKKSNGSANEYFYPSSQNTHSGLELPETAPLVFPILDHLAEQTNEEAIKAKDRLKKKSNIVDEYLDRRVPARWVDEHASAQSPAPEFTSRDINAIQLPISGNSSPFVSAPQNNAPMARDIGGMGGFDSFDRFGGRMGYGGFGGGYGGGYGYGDGCGYGYGPYGGFGGGRWGGGGFGRGFGGPFGGGRMGYGPYGGFGGGFGGYGRPMGGGLFGLAATLIDASDRRDAREFDEGMQMNPRMVQSGQPGMGMDNNYYQGRDVGTRGVAHTVDRGLDSDQNGQSGGIGNATGQGADFGGAGGPPSGEHFAPRGVKRLLSTNVSYLMIVNLPSEKELAASTEQYILASEKATQTRR